MQVLVDTSVWSEFLRRKAMHSSEIRNTLKALIEHKRLLMIGPVRQELLSGVRTADQFLELRHKLRAFPDHPISTEDYETAAEYFNRCRADGIQGSFTDFLICAVASNHRALVYTTDGDFQHYSRVLPVSLFRPAE